MCRGKSNGNRRCPHDNSEARKRRRRAVKGRDLYNHPIILDPDSQKLIPEDKTPKDIKELRKEAQLISALLHAPVNKDPKIQAEIDAKNELLVTRLGQQLGMEAERRAKFNMTRFDKAYHKISPEFTAATDAMKEAREEELEARMDYIEATGGTWKPGNDPQVDPETLAHLKQVAEEKKAAFEAAQAQWDIEDKKDTAKREKVKETARKKLTEAYKSVIAEMRPVGGDFADHKLSDNGALETVRKTVGKDYPSEWIQSSAQHGDLAIRATEERPNYNDQARFEGEEAKGLIQEEDSFQAFMPASRLDEFCRKMSEDGDIVTPAGGGIDIPGQAEKYHAVRFPHRQVFDPEMNTMGKNGKPEGEGWKYGYVLSDVDNVTISSEKQWYRTKPSGYGVMPVVSISPASNPESGIHAYHEAVHRFETSVGDGTLLGRMQEAFLKRRTTVDGNREKTVTLNITSDIHQAEFARQDGFMVGYIGRDYPTTKIHREVLPVGAEAAFGGKYGAFLGVDKYHREDRDHRAFVLGTFATA